MRVCFPNTIAHPYAFLTACMGVHIFLGAFLPLDRDLDTVLTVSMQVGCNECNGIGNFGRLAPYEVGLSPLKLPVVVDWLTVRPVVLDELGFDLIVMVVIHFIEG